MLKKVVASTALLAIATVVEGQGSAVVVNHCSYPVGLTNVPASGGGQSQIGPQSLSTGGSYSQVYTELSNGQGWSIKLSVGNSQPLQFEYTWHNDGTIWFDLSAVNGDPFNGNWLISSDGSCSPKQTAYLFPTDDANGEQSCADSSTVTVTLCGAGGAAPAPPTGSGAPMPPAAPPAAPPAQSAAPQVPSPSVPTPSVPAVPVPDAAPASAAPSAASANPWGPPADKIGGLNQFQGTPTTFDTVTNIHTKVVTQYVTISPSPVHKRSEHLHRHAERHNHF